MDVAITDISGCKKGLSIIIPADVAESAFDRNTQKLAGTVRLPGFRPGKAPPGIIRQRFQKEIKGQVIHELVETRLEELIKDQGLKPLSKPVIDKLEFELGSPLSLQISFEVWPEVNLPDYKDLTIRLKKPPEITDEDVEKVLLQYREDAAAYVPVEDRPIQTGDLVKLQVHSSHRVRDQWVKKDDQETTVTVGDPHLHPEFSREILGLTSSAEKEFTIAADFAQSVKQLPDKFVRFKVKVLDIKAKHYPEINDELAKDGGQYETLEQLRGGIRGQLRENAQHDMEEEAKEGLLDQVLEKHPLDVPEFLVENRLRTLMNETSQSLTRQGVDIKREKIDWKKVAEQQRPRAVQDVKKSLVLDQVAKREHLEILPAEVDLELARIAQAAVMSVEAVRAAYQQNGRVNDLKEELRLKKALDFIYRHAKLINDQGSDL